MLWLKSREDREGVGTPSKASGHATINASYRERGSTALRAWESEEQIFSTSWIRLFPRGTRNKLCCNLPRSGGDNSILFKTPCNPLDNLSPLTRPFVLFEVQGASITQGKLKLSKSLILPARIRRTSNPGIFNIDYRTIRGYLLCRRIENFCWISDLDLQSYEEPLGSLSTRKVEPTYVTEAAITNLEARPSRAKSFTPGDPPSRVIYTRAQVLEYWNTKPRSWRVARYMNWRSFHLFAENKPPLLSEEYFLRVNLPRSWRSASPNRWSRSALVKGPYFLVEIGTVSSYSSLHRSGLILVSCGSCGTISPRLLILAHYLAAIA